MFTLKYIRVPLIIGLLGTINFAKPDYHTEVKGDTWESGKKPMAYVETRKRSFISNRLNEAKVWYITPAQDTLAHKKLDYARSLLRPDINFKQYKLDYHLKVTNKGNQVYVDYKEGKKTLKKNFSVPQDAIMDGGIRNFIIANIDRLKKEKKIKFPLIVPERGDYYYFEVHLDKVINDNQIKMTMKPSSFILSMLAPKMELDYNISKQELNTYSGISDVKDAKGNNLKVYIEYN